MEDKADYDYRQNFPPIHLGVNGSIGDFDSQASVLDDLWNMLPNLSVKRQDTAQPLAIITEREIQRAWKRWIQSHHSFFCFLALLSYSYSRLQAAADQVNTATITMWAGYISTLWRGSGALMVYGCDFHPTAPIYCGYIRPKMPEAFSGLWLREWTSVHRALTVWQNFVKDNDCADIVAAASEVKAGFDAYHEYHKVVMRAAVPEGDSLAQEYRMANGCKHSIAAAESSLFDDWFRVVRIESQTRMEFIHAACQAFTETVEELVEGHHLADVAIRDIANGINTAIYIFGEWLGPIPETSKYYPRAMRGE